MGYKILGKVLYIKSSLGAQIFPYFCWINFHFKITINCSEKNWQKINQINSTNELVFFDLTKKVSTEISQFIREYRGS